MPVRPPEIAREIAYAIGDHARVATAAGFGSTVYANRLCRCAVADTTVTVAPAYDTAPGPLTTDGTAAFEPMNAWRRSGLVVDVIHRASLTASIDEPRAVDG